MSDKLPEKLQKYNFPNSVTIRSEKVGELRHISLRREYQSGVGVYYVGNLNLSSFGRIIKNE